jgi:hypothetical protein
MLNKFQRGWVIAFPMEPGTSRIQIMRGNTEPSPSLSLTSLLYAFLYLKMMMRTPKVKLSRYTPWRRLGWETVSLLLILNLGTRWGLVVSVTPRPRFTPGERTPDTHCTGLDAEARRKILYLCRGSKPVVQSVVSHYNDWATPAPMWTYNYYTHQ